MYKRVLLKLSGEALGDKTGSSIIDVANLKNVANGIKELVDEGIEVAVVIGAGNIFRGKLADDVGIDRVPADFMGMMGTVMNALAMQGALQRIGVKSLVYSAIPEIKDVTMTYDANKVKDSLKEGYVCFLAGGTGKPFFTTDTASTLRAIETDCDAILMAKNGVKGVYDKDPRKYPDATFLPVVTFKEMEEKQLQVMDASAIELIKNTNLEILVFSMADISNFKKAARGENVGTVVKKEK